MQIRAKSINRIRVLLLAFSLPIVARAQPAFTELSSPDGYPAFGWDFGALPDLTQDGVSEFYIRDARRIYLYDGANLELLYAIDSSRCDPDFTAHTADSAGDLTGDGVPELMFGQICAGGHGQVIMIDGKTGAELFRLNSPEPVGYFGHTVFLLPDMTGDGKADWLIHERAGSISSQPADSLGRVFIFDSQTRQAVRTLWNKEPDFNFNMEFVAVIPDVDQDGKPELLTSARFTSVRRDGRTYANSGRALVRSLATGQVLYELLDPELTTEGRFGLNSLSPIGDLTGDGISDIAVGAPLKSEVGGVYLFSGADGQWLRTLHSPKSQLRTFGGRIELMGDLNGDSVPELWIEENFALLTHIFDGRTSKLLKSIDYPGLVLANPQGGPKFKIGVLQRQDAPDGRSLLFGAPGVANSEGRVYYMPFTPLPNPPRLKPLGANNTGFLLHVIADSGNQVEVQATSDFKNWEPVATVTTGPDPVEAEDSTAAHRVQRFYRAVQPGD